jgi:hypothetical protein
VYAGHVSVRAFVSAAATVVLTVGVIGCQSKSADIGHAAESQSINETKGTFRGVGLGDPESKVLKRLGAPARRGFHGPDPWRGRPLHEQPTKCPRSPGAAFDIRTYDELTYEGARFLIAPNHRVCSVVVIQDGAGTLRGVAIGDSIDEARERYPHAYCAESNDNTFDPPETFHFCALRLRPARNLWFGGDPIDTVDLELKGTFRPKT